MCKTYIAGFFIIIPARLSLLPYNNSINYGSMVISRTIIYCAQAQGRAWDEASRILHVITYVIEPPHPML